MRYGVAALLVVLASAEARAEDAGPGDADLDGGADAGDGGPGDADLAPASCPPDARGCASAGAAWSYRDALFDDLYLDTGWVPADGPLQLRFGLALGGSTEVDMEGIVLAAWPPAIAIGVEGLPERGRLAINYGLELVARLRFDVEVAGLRYSWEGDIPVPGIPEDLRMAAEAVFDPFLLPGAPDRPVTVHDLTDPVRVVAFDALDAIIPVPGVGGGLLVALQGELEAGYQSERFVVTGAEDPIEEVGGTTTLRSDPRHDGFGGAAEVALHPEGTLLYDGEVLILPSLYLEVVGVRFDYPIAEIPLPLVTEDAAAVFDDAVARLPLPDVEVTPPMLDLGEVQVGVEGRAELSVDNVGEAELEVRVRGVGEPFGTVARTVTVAPGESVPFAVTFSPQGAGGAGTMLLLDTNDPDEPEVRVMLLAEGVPAPEPPDAGPELDADAGPPDADGDHPPRRGGCACRAGSGEGLDEAPPLALLAALALTGFRRRPRAARWRQLAQARKLER